jgi:hypothetical protein
LASGAASLALVLTICIYPGARAPRAWGWALALFFALTVMFGVLALARPARAAASSPATNSAETGGAPSTGMPLDPSRFR